MSEIEQKKQKSSKITGIDITLFIALGLAVITAITGPYRRYSIILGVVIFFAIGFFTTRQEKEEATEAEHFSDPEVGGLLKEIQSEVKILKNSGKKLNISDTFMPKLDEIVKRQEVIEEKYFFIKDQFGAERGAEQLGDLKKLMSDSRDSLKGINDNFLKLYATSDQDHQIVDDLDHVLTRLDASVDLKEI